MKTLLSVDLGVKTGIAYLSENGEILWYRSHNFGNKSRLSKAIYSLIKETEGLEYLVIEGGGNLATPWIKEANRLSIKIIQIQAETWRKELLPKKNQSNTLRSKSNAVVLASEIIKKSTGASPKSLNDDAAEAILSGYWALKNVGWQYAREFFPHPTTNKDF